MNNDSVMSFLKSVPLFNTLGPVMLSRLAENSSSLKFARGATVLEGGSRCSSIYVVASGKLEAYRTGKDKDTEIILQTFNRGDVFGDECALDGAASAAGLRTAENSLVIGIDRLFLLSLIKENPEFCKSYLRYLGGRVRAAAAREGSLLRVILQAGVEVPDPYELRKAAPKREEPRISPAPPPPKAPATPAPQSPKAQPAQPALQTGVVINQINSPEEYEEGGESDEVFFKKKLACPLCAFRFQTLKPRQKHIIAVKSDDDFCMYYKSVNPLFYEINVCPGCGYSFNMSSRGTVGEETKKGLSKKLAEIKKTVNYCGPRTLEDAAETFRMAIECQKLTGLDNSGMGRLHLKLAWLNRYLNLKDREYANLDKALYHLSKSFEEGTSNDLKEEMNLMFLLGQLHLILGDEKGALNWFVRITQHPERKSYPYIVNRARDTWQELRKKHAKS